MKKSVEVTIITPAHNEEAIISGFVKRAHEFFRQEKIHGEILVVENGSRDGTNKILQNLKKTVPDLDIRNLREGNKGEALKLGIKSAKGNKIITLDTDLWDEEFVKKSLTYLNTHDIVIGSKSTAQSNDKRSYRHRLLTRFYNFAFRLVFDLKATDTKARLSFRKDKIEKIVNLCKTSDLIFDTELLIRSERAGLKIIECPSDVTEIRGQRYSIRNRWKGIVLDFVTLVKTLGPTPNIAYLVFFFSLFLGALTRLYKYKDWFFFEVDEEHYAFMTRMITVNHHLPLIGGPISGTRLYMAPWFLYFSSIWYFLTHNSPILFGVVSTILGLLTTWFLYLIGKRILTPLSGALAGLLYSSSFAMILYDRHQWNVTLLPLISVATMYFLMRWIDGGKRWLVLASLVVTFGISSTFTAFAVFLFALFIVVFGKKPYLKKDVLIFLGIIAACHFTLILFDLRHNFWLFFALRDFFFHPIYASVPLMTRFAQTVSLLAESLGKALVIYHPLDIADESSICVIRVMRYFSPTVPVVISIVLLLTYVWLSLKNKLSNVSKLPLALLAINVLSLIFFRADPSERHWLPFYPFFFLSIAVVVCWFSRRNKFAKILGCILVFVLASINLFAFFNSWTSYGWTTKNAAAEFVIENTQSGKFYLDAVGECHEWGYRYQFSEFNHEPAGSYMDGDFTWMYNVSPKPQDAIIKATIISPNKNVSEPPAVRIRREEEIVKSFKMAKFGNVEVYLENLGK